MASDSGEAAGASWSAAQRPNRSARSRGGPSVRVEVVTVAVEPAQLGDKMLAGNQPER